MSKKIKIIKNEEKYVLDNEPINTSQINFTGYAQKTELHKHLNRKVIDNFGEDEDGNPTYNGSTLGTVDFKGYLKECDSHFHGNIEELNKISENTEGNFVYDGKEITGKMILEEYSEIATYKLDDYVVYDNKIYKCIVDSITSKPFNETEWEFVVGTDNNIVEVSQEEYDKLKADNKIEKDKAYLVYTDEDSVGENGTRSYNKETIWEGSAPLSSQNTTYTLNKSIEEFDLIKIYAKISGLICIELDVDEIKDNYKLNYVMSHFYNTSYYAACPCTFVDANTFEIFNPYSYGWSTSDMKVYKIVGIKY